MLGNIIKRFIVEMLRREQQFTPFTFVDAEMERRPVYEVSPELRVNTVMFVDRVDRLPDGRMRFVDYKTGNDKISFTSVAQMFDPASSERRKAVLQLMLYANLYRLSDGYEGAVQLFIYQFKSIFMQGLNPIVYNKDVFDDHRVVNDEFLTLFNGVLTEMFDPTVPFRQADNAKSCEYCGFKAVCGRDDS